MPLIPVGGVAPRIDPSAWVAPDATIAGDVEVGPESSIWFGVVARGDVHRIRIGARTNVQDLSCLHVTRRKFGLTIGDEVTVGHMALLHGCEIRDRVLVGMRAVVMDGAVVGPDAIVGAGALVTQGTVVPPGTLAFGSPARVVRELTEEERAFLKKSAANYVEYSAWYR